MPADGGDGRRVLLASMPFSSPRLPNLALSTLKPLVEAAGALCDVRYFSLDYVGCLGPDRHDLLTEPGTYMAHVGEWAFAACANGADAEEDDAFLTRTLPAAHPEQMTAHRLLAALEARAGAAAFIDRCVQSVAWEGYAVLGLTSSFQQTMASLALARRVKAAFPHVLVVLGGANCQDEMGQELHERYPFLDAVCLGEGDHAFPELVRRHLGGEALAGIPGMAVRRNGRPVPPARRADPVTDLDALPYPDFHDFFAQRRSNPAASAYAPSITFETARGCWWGAKQHCTFCGLNGTGMAFRSKSQDRAFEELSALVQRYGVRDVANADNILDMAYFGRFLPRLAEERPGLSIFYEVKANLKPWQLALLWRAGVRRIQPGIESLDTSVLRLMRKGTTSLQNVQLLKLAAEAGIYVEWLALSGFPGEDEDAYGRSAALVPKLRHLQPPAAVGRVRADRFSPYQGDPAAHGVTLEPLPVYRHLFPFGDAAVRRLAYHFAMVSPALERHDAYTAGATEQYALWHARQKESALWCEDDGRSVVVQDRRWGWPETTTELTGAAAALHRLCWQATPWRQVLADLAPHGAAALAAAADELDARGLLLREGDNLLALALRQPGYRAAPSWDEVRRGDLQPHALSWPASPPARQAGAGHLASIPG